MNSQVVATSQTSRFHVDTLTTSNEIDLKDVTISVMDHDIIKGSHLRLKAGVHYSLVGRNGLGKSTLLNAISDKIIPGIPLYFRILLVSQVEQAVTTDEENLSVTERVVKSDKRRERALAEYASLSQALDSSSLDDLASAVASIKLERSVSELEEAKNLALRRSGARGADARQQLLKAEKQVSEGQALVQRAKEVVNPQIGEEATSLLLEIQSTLDAMDASATEAKARSILHGLGFSVAQLDAKFTTLSGGWRSRCSLACALLQQPDLLLLDEPTNFLDLQSIIWLQNYITSIASTVLVVAHDLEFVDAISDEVIILRNQKLAYFEGNLSAYEANEKKVRKGLMKMKNTQDRKKQAIEKSIEEGKRTAKKTGDENRARMAKSRQKKLDDRWGLERSDKGTRFKLNRDLVGYHNTSRKALEIDEGDPPIVLSLPDPPPLRFPGSLISAENVSFKYSGSSNQIVQDLTLTLHPGSRTGLLGLNGRGKSTMVKLLIGTLRPTRGKVEQHPRLRLGYYAQHSVEELSNSSVTSRIVLDYFQEKISQVGNVEINEGLARAFLGGFGLGKRATVPISALSGGQKVRLALALVVYPAPDLLVLDEVSTHLDMDTVTALILALRRYSGAVLLVTHDRHLMKCVVEGHPLSPPSEDPEEDQDEDDEQEGELRTGPVYMVTMKGTLKLLQNGTDEYVQIVERRMRKEGLIT